MGPELDIAPVATARVPFMALERQHGAMGRELTAAYERVARQSTFVLGEEVERFEHEFAAACGVARCVGVASGTAALTLALKASGIGPGDEVIVSAHTFIASILAVLHAGATPIFCDVEPGTGLIDPSSAAAVVTERTAAVIAVHLYGQACEMDALGELARHRGLLVVEDAAQAHGATLPRTLRWDRWARSRRSASIRARTWGRSATPARSAPTTPRSRAVRGSCGTSASGARTSTSRSATTSGSTASRPPSCGRSCRTSTTSTARDGRARSSTATGCARSGCSKSAITPRR